MSEQHDDIESPRREPLGSIFERTRRGRHVTLEEAAEATRISPRVLAALEADDFSRLPAEVFTRGFIKLYAEYLGLDPNEILAHYINQENADPDKPAERPYRREVLEGEAMAHAPSFFKGNRRIAVIVLLLAVLIGLYLLGRSYNRAGEKSGGDGVSRSLLEKQAAPQEAVRPAAEQVQGTPPGGEVTKAGGPGADALKVPGSTGQPGISPAGGAPPETKPGPGPETQPPARPQPLPANPQPAAPVKSDPPVSPFAATNQAAKATGPDPAGSAVIAAGQPGDAASHRTGTFQPVTVKVATTAVDGAEDLSTSPAASSGPRNYVLEGRFRGSSWVHVEVDDAPAREYTSQADVTRVWRAARHLVLELGNGGAVDLTLNGKPLPVTVKPGEATIIRIPQP